MPSFDITSEFNEQEVTNAIDQMNREIINRYDFKDTNTSVSFSNETILLRSSTEERLQAADQVLREKFAKRNVSIKFLSNFTDEQLTALRNWVSELSPDTLMVAGSVDDSDQLGGHGHEILISDGDGDNFIAVTYGSQPSDETDSYYLYHTTEDLTSTDNVYITGTYPTITALDPNYLFPAQIQLGWASSDNGQWGGAAYWGFEEDYFAVR